MRARAHLLTALSLVIGAVLFALIVKQTGARELWARVQALDARFAWVLLVSGLRPLLRACAWLRCLRVEERGVGLFNVWRARLIGDAVGNLTTAGPLLAEPARLIFFSAHLPLPAAAASLLLEFFSYVLGACVVMLSGLLMLPLAVELSVTARAVCYGLALGLSAALGGAALAWWRRWSVIELLRKVGAHISSLHSFLQVIITRLAPPLRQLQRVEEHHFDFYRRQPRDFALVCLCEAGFHLCGVLEVWLTLQLLNVRTSLLAVFLFEAAGRLINFAFAFVPVRLGVDEAGAGWLAAALGLGSLTGVTLAVYRKLRVLFWTAVGLLLLTSFYVQQKRSEPV